MNIIFPVYNISDEILSLHLKEWHSLPEEIRNKINLIIVDDCSPNPFPINIYTGFKTKIARVNTDIKWHAEGAFNLGFLLADDDWCVLLQSDHVMPTEEIIKMVNLKKERGNLYVFQRMRPDGTSRNKNVASMTIIHRDDYWLVGGYDEDFCENHGGSDWLTWGQYYNPNRAVSVADTVGMKYVQTNIKIIEYQEKISGGARWEGNNLNKGLIMWQNKLKEVLAGTYVNRAKLHFTWKILRSD